MGLKREANDLAYIVCLNDKRDGKNYTCGYCQGRKPGQKPSRKQIERTIKGGVLVWKAEHPEADIKDVEIGLYEQVSHASLIRVVPLKRWPKPRVKKEEPSDPKELN